MYLQKESNRQEKLNRRGAEAQRGEKGKGKKIRDGEADFTLAA
jgi:hypothetical protein